MQSAYIEKMPQLAGRPKKSWNIDKPVFQSLDVYRNIGENIRELRNSIPVSQTRFALYIGISHDTLSNIERGKCRSEYALLRAIADLFYTTTDTLATKNSYVELCDRSEIVEALRLIFPEEERKYFRFCD